jgi:Ca2+-binding RTX toxin-like protein
MAKSLKQLFDRDELLGSTAVDAYIWTKPPQPDGPAAGPGGILNPGPQPLPPLFTWGHDNVNFANVDAGEYAPASYYNALRGNDTVVLPPDQVKATAIGYDPTKDFHGEAGDDFIVGGALNDRVFGDMHNDRLFGNSGDDFMAGGNGDDQLFGAAGNDVLYAGVGLDYIDAGSGDDLIFSTEDDELALAPFESVPGPFGPNLYQDEIHAGSGDDVVFACATDKIYADSGDDIIHLIDYTPAPGQVPGVAVGDAGNDVILGSDQRDEIFTGSYYYFWGPETYNPVVKALLGGFDDVVNSKDGNDLINTMPYCNATVNTGAGHDEIFVVGLRDVISMEDGFDLLTLYGGACKADLGDGNDTLRMTRAAYDNPNVSEITLGAGADSVYFATNEWFTNGDQQPLSRAPWVLDFKVDEDIVSQIDVTNLDDATQSLNADYIKAIDIAGGSALIYDDLVNDGLDFCFGRFSGVSAEALQKNVDLNTFYA